MLPLSDTQLMVMVVSSITASCQVPLLSWVFHVPVRLSGSFLVSCCVVVVCLLSVLVVLVFAHAVSVVMSSAAHVMADSVVVSFLIFLSLSFCFYALNPASYQIETGFNEPNIARLHRVLFYIVVGIL